MSDINDQPDFSDGVMLCVRPEDPGRFVLEGGTPVEDIHLTLLYFGKTDIFDGPAADQAKEVLGSEVAPKFTPLRGEITAVTTFGQGGEDEPALVLLVDAPGLTVLQTDCLLRLRSALGSDTQPYSNHGFMPHITVAYGATPEEIAQAEASIGQPVEFNFLEFLWGTEPHIMALGAEPGASSIPNEEASAALQLDEIPDPRPEMDSSYAEEAEGMSSEENEATATVSEDRAERLDSIQRFLAVPSPIPVGRPDGPDAGPELAEVIPDHKAIPASDELCPGSGQPLEASGECAVCTMPIEDMIPQKSDDPGLDPGIDDGRLTTVVDEEFSASGAAAMAFSHPLRPWGAAEARRHLGNSPTPEVGYLLSNGTLPFADFSNGAYVAVPRALLAAAASVHINELKLSDDDLAIVKGRLEHLFARLRDEFEDRDFQTPWERGVHTYDATDHTEFAACPVHHTATSDTKDFDGDVVKTRTRHGMTPDYYNAIYAWRDSTNKPTNKTGYRFPHHQVSEAGDPGVAVDWACRAALMLIDDSGIPKGDYQGVYNHLAAHLKDAGMEVPDLGSDNASTDEVRTAIATLTAQFEQEDHIVEAIAMEKTYDLAGADDTALVGEMLRRFIDGVATGGGSEVGGGSAEVVAEEDADEFAPKKGVNPFPPKKKDDDEDEDEKPSDEKPSDESKPSNDGKPEVDEKPVADKPAEEEPSDDKKDDDKPDDADAAPAKENPFPPKKDEDEAAPKVAAPAAPVAPKPIVPPAPVASPEDEDPLKKKKIGGSSATFEWEGVLIVEGVPSGDGRMIDAEALTWRELPVPLMLQTVNAEGHSGAVICGSIKEIERVGQDIVGRGNFDSGEAGQEAKRLLGEGTMRGVSADIDSVMIDLRDSNGNAVNMEDVLFGEAKAMEVLVQGRIMGATLTPFPAFQEAHIEVLDNAAEDPALVAAGSVFDGEVWRFRSPHPVCLFGVHEPYEVKPIVASAGEMADIPVAPPTEWFALRDMDEPQPFTVYPDGRCFGLVAQFGSCHIGFRNRCVEVPRSMSNYRFFRNKRTLSAEGEMIATGPIFMDTVHPSLKYKASDAEAHYAHTGCAVADVALYENEHGIVAAGALRPDVTPEQVRRLRGSDISPDWRSIKGRLELIGLLGVNVSGFVTPALAASGAEIHVETLTPRAQVNVATDEVEALVAAGAIRECKTCSGASLGNLGADAVGQIFEMLSSHEARLTALSAAIRPMRAERVSARLDAFKGAELASEEE